MNKPFFSVVLPTRNRASFLPFAIQSILSQTFEDFEIVISDNCSSDETPDVAQNFGDERIKYFRSEKSLSMGDSWQFALGHPKGEFITFLSDDDAYAKVFLETMASLINRENADLVSCNLAHYSGVNAFDYGRNIKSQSLIIHPFSRESNVFNRKESVAALLSRVRLTSESNRWQSFISPQLINSAYHFSVIDKVRERISKLFPILAGDTYSSPLFLNVAQKYCSIDEPLYLSCQWEESATSGEETLFQKYPEERIMDYIPLKKLLSIPNYNTNAILRAKYDWGADFQEVPLDWSYYFTSSFQEIKYMQVNGIDVSEQLEEFERALSEQSQELQKKVKSEMSAYDSLSRIIRSKLKKSIIGNNLLKLKHQKIKVFDNFDNIAQCAETIDEAFLQRYAG